MPEKEHREREIEQPNVPTTLPQADLPATEAWHTREEAQEVLSPHAFHATERRGGTLKILQLIGRGASSDVYIGHDDEDTNNPHCVIKVLKEDVSEWRERFERREQRALGQWRPGIGIPRMRSIGTVNDRPSIVMDFHAGYSLETLLKDADSGHFSSPVIACEIAANIARTLYLLHEETGLIHRDIKPGNVHICDTGEVLLLDFGLARMRDDSTQTDTNRLFGTLRYIAPEQAQDARNVNAQADVFSLGVLTAEMLTGRVPFAHTRVLQGDVECTPDLGTIPERSLRIARMLEAMLHHAPSNRPTMREVAAFFLAQSSRLQTLPLSAFFSTDVGPRIALDLPPPPSAPSGTTAIPSVFVMPKEMLASLERSYAVQFLPRERGTQQGTTTRQLLRRVFILGSGVAVVSALPFLLGRHDWKTAGEYGKQNMGGSAGETARNGIIAAEAAFDGNGALKELHIIVGESKWTIAPADCIAMSDGEDRPCAWVFQKKPEEATKITARDIGFLFSRKNGDKRHTLIVLPHGEGLILLEGEAARIVGRDDPSLLSFLTVLPSPAHGSKTPTSWGRYTVYGGKRGIWMVQRVLQKLKEDAGISATTRPSLSPIQSPPKATRGGQTTSPD